MSSELQCRGLWIPIEIYSLIESGELDCQEVIVATIIEHHVKASKPAQGCFMTNAAIGKRLNLSNDRVSKIIAKLTEKKIIVQIGWKVIPTGRLRVLVTCWTDEKTVKKIKRGLSGSTEGGDGGLSGNADTPLSVSTEGGLSGSTYHNNTEEEYRERIGGAGRSPTPSEDSHSSDNKQHLSSANGHFSSNGKKAHPSVPNGITSQLEKKKLKSKFYDWGNAALNIIQLKKKRPVIIKGTNQSRAEHMKNLWLGFGKDDERVNQFLRDFEDHINNKEVGFPTIGSISQLVKHANWITGNLEKYERSKEKKPAREYVKPGYLSEEESY